VNEYDDDDEFRHSPSISASPRIVSLYTELYAVRCGLAVLRPAIWPSTERGGRDLAGHRPAWWLLLAQWTAWMCRISTVRSVVIPQFRTFTLRSEGWRPPGAQSTFIRWTGWTLTMTLGHDDSTINIVMAIIIIIIITLFWNSSIRLLSCGNEVANSWQRRSRVYETVGCPSVCPSTGHSSKLYSYACLYCSSVRRVCCWGLGG